MGLLADAGMIEGLGGATVGAGSDAVTYTPPLRRIYVGGAGNVKVNVLVPGGPNIDVTYSAVPVGTYLQCRAVKVYATGTTATLMVGEY